MTRGICLALAIAFGLTAAVLFAASPTAHFQGEAKTCQAVMLKSEAAGGQLPDPVRPARSDPAYVDYRLSQACDRLENRSFVLACLAGFLCLAAGSIAQLSRQPAPGSAAAADGRPREPART